MKTEYDERKSGLCVVDKYILKYILWYMNTHTILNVKTDKKLKAEAKRISEDLGVPLSTVVNAFLKQFVRDKEITLSLNQYRMTSYLENLVAEARKEYAEGNVKKYRDVDTFLKALG